MSGRKQKEKRRGATRWPNLRIELLEQRQLLYSLNAPPKPSVYDEILLTGASLAADHSEAVRVSFLDGNGELVHAEFSGNGPIEISLDNIRRMEDADESKLSANEQSK